jgi:hypothetical protein
VKILYKDSRGSLSIKLAEEPAMCKGARFGFEFAFEPAGFFFF